MKRRAAVWLCACLLPAASASGQEARDVGERLIADATVQAALAAVERNAQETLDEQVRLCEIPAPPFGEERRGQAMKAAFEALGLHNVRVDAVGNVTASGRGARRVRTWCSPHTWTRCSPRGRTCGW